MAHASLDSHLDFFSLLSLAHIGVIEPEMSWVMKERQASLNDQQRGLENSQHPHTHPTAPMLGSDGGPVQPVNGLYKGLKRSRDQAEGGPDEVLEAAQFPEEVQYVIKRSCPEMRTHSVPAPYTSLSPLHNGHSHFPSAETSEVASALNGAVPPHEHAQNGAVPPQEHAMDMDHQPEHTASNGHTAMDQCVCNGRGGKRKVQFCTGMIEEVMSSSQLGVSSLVVPCARCQCGQPECQDIVLCASCQKHQRGQEKKMGHLHHLTPTPTTSVMDTS